MKELKDYLHLYLGCDCITPDGVLILNSLNINDSRKQAWFYCRWSDSKNCYLPKRNAEILGKQSLVGKAFKYSEIKPILRPLSDINIKEVFECEEFMWDGFYVAFTGDKDSFLKSFLSLEVGYRLTFETYTKAANWLRKHSFDCDDLIEAGLAIDKSTLKQSTTI